MKTSPARLAAQRRYNERNRERILYEKRVKYWRGAREEILARNNRSRGDPERKARYAQRALDRQWKRRQTRESRQAFAELQLQRGLSVRDMERPSYKIKRGGKTRLELWPLEDEAARWLAAHAPAQAVSTDTAA